MIPEIRVVSQQLANPTFKTPKDIVSWMGAIQAQDYAMSKWAVGIRSESITIKDVEEALQRGEIVRTHIMRPTWHLVPAEDLRWMIKLSSYRLKTPLESYSKHLGIPEDFYIRTIPLVEKVLGGNKHLTKQEIGEELDRMGMKTELHWIHYAMFRSEIEGIVCNGIDKGKKQTYTLIDERIAPTPELHKEEALAKLAKRYFQSHSPASVQDFSWWSGLTLTELKQAVHLISNELISETFASEKLLVHESYHHYRKPDDQLHFLPAYDEYLISYKDRKNVLDPEHQHKAFSNNGLFRPVILYRGQIVGNWKKVIKKGNLTIETTFFDQDAVIDQELIKQAENKYKAFISNT